MSHSRAGSRRRLRELAGRLGIIPEYIDQTGRRVRRTTDDTREALLAVMGFDAPTEDAAAGWLAELDHEERSGIVAPVAVVERDAAAARTVRIRVPPELGRDAHAQITVIEETGREWTADARVRGAGAVRLAAPLLYGYHRLRVELSAPGGRTRAAEQSRIVVPGRCTTPDVLLGADRVWGVVANLYATRRETDWGVGDLRSLDRLVQWGARRGAEFVGVNPLHALLNTGTDISPYSPVSRLFRNHIYIDVADVTWLADVEDGASILAESQREAAALRAAPQVDYERVIAVKNRALFAAYQVFLRLRGGSHRRGFDAFVAAREPELTRYATWMTLAERSGRADWRQWPEPMHDPGGSAVAAVQKAEAERIDFHRWLQYETHLQLGGAAATAKRMKMRIGVYQDLAIGTHPGGSDTWSYPDLFLRGASIGAPPDPYSALGQNWGLPPMDPRVLRAQGYRYWIQLLRHGFEHAGALRIDHVMGLFRTFWIPDGLTGKEGAYVRYPSADLLGILALESVRSGALVVGEDLGTVPADVPPAMRKWGVLSSKVLYFEQDRDGFRRASRYPELSLATANTHDMATLAGFWSGADVATRRAVGLIASAREEQQVRRVRARERRNLLRVLRHPRPAANDAGFAGRLTAAVHAFLCSTRARLVGLAWDDLLGETEPVNVPGVGQDRFPSWRRRNRMTVEAAEWDAGVDAAIGCAQRRRTR